MSIDSKSTHYDAGGIEVLEIIRAKLTPEQFQGFCLGNALKYLCRANHKGDFDRDIEKAGVYIMELAGNGTIEEIDRSDAEEFLLRKNISNHPHIQDSVTREHDYEVADLMAEFANEIMHKNNVKGDKT